MDLTSRDRSLLDLTRGVPQVLDLVRLPRVRRGRGVTGLEPAVTRIERARRVVAARAYPHPVPDRPPQLRRRFRRADFTWPAVMRAATGRARRRHA